jgi:AraC family transcriptional activator of pobA
MRKKPQKIQKFDLSPLAKAGLVIKNLDKTPDVSEHESRKPHRDNHYLLALLTHGNIKLNLDFQDVDIYSPALLLIAPGRVHHMIETLSLQGWAISFDASLMNNEFQLMFDRAFSTPIALNAQTPLYQHLFVLMDRLEQIQADVPNAYTSRANQALLNTIFNLIAGQIVSQGAASKTRETRGVMIEQAFMQLLKQHYKSWKQPAQYAAELNISVTHLYDTVREITGSSASVQIQEYCILEAKRLLYFTDLSVKEIGYELGYQEPVYFGKLFKKVTGMTPLQFRRKYHD